MRINAAVLWEQGRPLSVEAIDLGTPGPGEVLVEMRAAGVCHSDLHPGRGDWPMKTPVILGHERAGIVLEVGGVGLNVVQGARIAGCERIVAVDRGDRPLALARQFGATDAINAATGVAAAVRDLTGGRGADFAFDTVGAPATLTSALESVRKGGTVVLTGLSRADSQGTIAMFPFVMQEKRLIGSVYGSGRPATDIPRLA